MRVVAALYYASPCALHDPREYNSVSDVYADFETMRLDYKRFGGAKPVACVTVDSENTDYPSFFLEVGPRGGIVRIPA